MAEARITTWDSLRREPLAFYVEKLKKNEYFSMIRFGDGEFYCMWGLGGGINSNGCLYMKEVKDGLDASMSHAGDPTFIFGMQHVLGRDVKRARAEYPVEWFDTEVFGEALADGELYPLIEQLRKMKTVVISGVRIKEAVERVLGNKHFIETPQTNSIFERERILAECRALAPACFLFSCGLAANVFVSELHGLKDSFLLDMGHIWDPFAGILSRCDIEGKTKEEIERNLFP